ncbi:uncharacterized protein PAC_12874 [Phialocephala subalpina]|uniref:Uncharacterized protein n=1 Tax=Phialocephala subalpina TaxID=576137 RepID=A0A1L7XDD7_9HELO|nr:uncharacterized protein PAC_12874 [Phialocephala subalpina]
MFHNAVKLRGVSLELHPLTRFPSEERSFITEFPFYLKGCKALSKLSVTLPVYKAEAARRANLLTNLLIRICKKTVVMRGRAPGPSDNHSYVSATEWWEWKAYPDELMDWTQELGWNFQIRWNLLRDGTSLI